MNVKQFYMMIGPYFKVGETLEQIDESHYKVQIQVNSKLSVSGVLEIADQGMVWRPELEAFRDKYGTEFEAWECVPGA